MAIFTNQATLIYNQTATNSNVATGEILDAVNVTKTAVTERYTPGSDITYVIGIVSTDRAAQNALVVTDDLGAYTVGGESFFPLSYVPGSVRLFVNGELQAAPSVSTENGLRFSGISLPAQSNALILYEARVTEYADPSSTGTIVNTASVTGGTLAEAISATETVSAQTGASLSVTKSISPATVTENSRVTYTFVIQNFGNEETTEEGAAILEDRFLPILRDLLVSYNGETWTPGVEYQYNEATGQFTTLPGQITVPGASFQRNAETGVWETTPGFVTLTVVGTI